VHEGHNVVCMVSYLVGLFFAASFGYPVLNWFMDHLFCFRFVFRKIIG